MVGMFKRGKKLYLKYEVDGKTVQKSTRLDDTPKNRKLVEREVIPEIERKLRAGEITTERTRPKTFGEYCDKYASSKEHLKSWHEVNRQVLWWEKKIGRKREAASIGVGEIEEIITEKAEGTSWRTAKYYLSVISAILKIAHRYGDIPSNPATLVETGRHVRKKIEPFTPEEAAALIDAADGWFKNYLAVAFYTGMRPGEILGLMHHDIDLNKMLIRVERACNRGEITTPKTEGSVRSVPVFSALLPFLKRQMADSASSLYLFPSQDGGAMYGASSLRKQWSNVIEETGVQYRKIYATRHTFITSMLKTGEVSVVELAQMVGHSTTEMIVKNYARFVTDEHMRIGRSIDPFKERLVTI